MDPLRIHAYKTRAIKKRKGQQLLNDFILYSLTALACTSFCSSPLWYPPFCATFNVFFFFSLPKITSFFFTSKALFILGNLIVIFLLGESKFFASKSKAYYDVCDYTYEPKHLDKPHVISTCLQKGEETTINTPNVEMQIKILESKACEEDDHDEYFELYCDQETCESNVEEEKSEGLKGNGNLSLPVDELNKLADEFIAKINRQRRLEAQFCRG